MSTSNNVLRSSTYFLQLVCDEERFELLASTMSRGTVVEVLENAAREFEDADYLEEACLLLGQAAKTMLSIFTSHPDLHCAMFAEFQARHSKTLFHAGHFEAACATSEMAVTLLRDLFDFDPDTYGFQLVEAWSVYSCTLTTLGRYGEACDVDHDVVALTRQHAYESLEYLPALADALFNYSISLNDVGRFDDACAAGEEAVSLRRYLLDLDDTPAAAAALSDALFHYSVSLFDAGRVVEACIASRDAVKLRRQLYEADREEHRADLISFLYRHAGHLRTQRLFSSAQAAVHEAKELRYEAQRLQSRSARRFRLVFV